LKEYLTIPQEGTLEQQNTTVTRGERVAEKALRNFREPKKRKKKKTSVRRLMRHLVKKRCI